MASVAAYRQAMGSFAGMRTMDVWYARLSEEELLAEMRREVRAVKQGAKGPPGARRTLEPPAIARVDQ
jgi:hypothetical protein